MKRSTFIKSLGLTTAGTVLWQNQLLNAAGLNSELFPELAKHKISKVDLVEVKYHWPRFVGKNGRIDFHGQDKKCTVLKIYTNQGAMGWGLSSNKAEDLFPFMENKKVSDLIIPGEGIIYGLDRGVDFAFHDLMGVILNKPVFELIGNKGTLETPIYSGMIYLDELNPGNESKGLDAILENCEWDHNFGYRRLKIKIGRSGRWYSHDEGLQKDIEVVKLIHDSFKSRDTKLLVDSNDMYTLDDTIKFLDGIGDVPLFWIEEPFIEEIDAGRKLRKWMNKNGFKKTYYADGEYNANHEVCLQLGKEQMMDVFLPDINSFGFSKWLKLMPELEKIKMLSSPHAWGNRLKTNYITHIAAGLGNVITIEGVTCFSDDIDFGDYKIEDGKIKVSGAPGFGMKLLK